MTEAWPPNPTEEEIRLRLFKDSLMYHVATVIDASISDEGKDRFEKAAQEVEDAYARVREYAPEELLGGAPQLSYAQIDAALKIGGREVLLPRRILVHALAQLDHYFYGQATGHERVYDKPHLTEEERAAEHGLRYDLMIKLYKLLEPSFDVSLTWPPSTSSQ